MKGVNTEDKEIKIVNFPDDEHFLRLQQVRKEIEVKNLTFSKLTANAFPDSSPF